MGTTGNLQGMGIMYLDVIDTVFHSGDTWDLCHKISAEVSAVLCSV